MTPIVRLLAAGFLIASATTADAGHCRRPMRTAVRTTCRMRVARAPIRYVYAPRYVATPAYAPPSAYQRQPYAQPAPTYAPQAYQPAQPPIPAAPNAVPAQPASPGVAPSYVYTAAPDGPPAYYYSYNDTGELVIKQWMDWVFRGGLASGRPAPPLPIIGRMMN